MDPKDLPPMRTGLGKLGGQLVEPEMNDPAKKIKCRLISMIVVMTRQAGDFAYIYCVHDNREAAHAKDVELALKYQARHFIGTIDEPGIMTEIDALEGDIEDVFYGPSEDSSEDSDGDASDVTFDITEKREAAMKTVQRVDGVCVCDLCVKMRNAGDTWDAWVPTDDVEKYLKSSVDVALHM